MRQADWESERRWNALMREAMEEMTLRDRDRVARRVAPKFCKRCNLGEMNLLRVTCRRCGRMLHHRQP